MIDLSKQDHNQMNVRSSERKNCNQRMKNSLSGGVRSGPPPKRGPNPQGLTRKKFKSVKQYTKKLIRKSSSTV